MELEELDLKLDFSGWDGTGRDPRPLQEDFLAWISNTLPHVKVLVAQAPVGFGKSYVLRAIQRATGGAIVTPSNILIDQYRSDYPRVNYLKGKAKYVCSSGLTCADYAELNNKKTCPGCTYSKCRRNAIEGHPTFFNPMSLYTLRCTNGVDTPILCVDEMHQLASMILLLCGKRFAKSRYDFDDSVLNETRLREWLKVQVDKLYRLAKQYRKLGEDKKWADIMREAESAELTLMGLKENPENYAVWIEEGRYRGQADKFINVKPVQPPKFLVHRMLDSDRLLLISGTAFQHDIKELVGNAPYEFLDLPSPIPKQNRPIYNEPVPYDMNYKTDPEMVVRDIEKILDQHPNQNAIIHVSYSWGKKLAPLFTRPILTNTSENKDQIVEKFKKEGGVFLASGCAEGLDLKGDLCRLNIIPKLIYPDLNDPVVKKRKALPDGNDWYNLETLKGVIQQAGRSTRSPDDYSTTIVMDPGFAWRVGKYKKVLPQSFLEAIVWTKRKVK